MDESEVGLWDEIRGLRSAMEGHHWRLRTLESNLEVTRKRLASAEAALALGGAGRGARRPGLECRSQYGEDALIWDLCGGVLDGRYVEAGAVDGLRLSATAMLESLGWTGLLVEPVPDEAARCRENRPASEVVERALMAPGSAARVCFTHVRGAEVYSGLDPGEGHLELARSQGGAPERIEVASATLDEILEEVGASRWPAIDAVVLDLEGGEVDALRGFDVRRWRPRVLIVEDRAPDTSSDVLRLLGESGYVQVGRLRVNRVFASASDEDVRERARAIPGF